MLKSIKSVLIGITEEGREEQESRSAIGYGLSLAAQAGAHVTVQAASLKLVLTHAAVSDVAAGLAAAEDRRLAALATAVADKTARDAAAAGVACSIETSQLDYAELVAAFVAQARVHDLTLLDAEPSTIEVDRGLMEAVLFESGRPLLVVPPGRDAFAARRIVVAWDGSAQAARAVADALPFLVAAEAVDLLSVTGEKDLSGLVPGADLAPHLARHGVEVTVASQQVQNRDVAEALNAYANGAGADMIVMGAYKHSRLRQWVLGGVTQAMLKSCPLPLFLSH